MIEREPNVAAAAAAARLAHDVGKYIARTARNITLDGAPLPAVILRMLCRDLYALPAGDRASTVFSALSAVLPTNPILESVRALLGEIDRLEPSLRKSDPIAVARAVEIAITVEDSLRAYARSIR